MTDIEDKTNRSKHQNLPQNRRRYVERKEKRKTLIKILEDRTNRKQSKWGAIEEEINKLSLIQRMSTLKRKEER